jgi:hypothetical protein
MVYGVVRESLSTRFYLFDQPALSHGDKKEGIQETIRNAKPGEKGPSVVAALHELNRAHSESGGTSVPTLTWPRSLVLIGGDRRVWVGHPQGFRARS